MLPQRAGRDGFLPVPRGSLVDSNSAKPAKIPGLSRWRRYDWVALSILPH